MPIWREHKSFKVDDVVDTTRQKKSKVNHILDHAEDRIYAQDKLLQDGFFADIARQGRQATVVHGESLTESLSHCTWSEQSSLQVLRA